MRRTGGEGLLNSINHPLLRPWAWEHAETDLRHVHCLEIWNDPSWPDNVTGNPRAVTLWTELLNAGYRITGIGGSDFHRPTRPSRLRSWAGPAPTFTPRSSRGGRLSRPCASEAPPGEEPKVYGIGDDLGIRGGRIDLVAAVADSPLPGAARIVRNGTVLAEARLQDGAAALRVSEVLDPAAPAWYRLDVLDDAGLVLAITNPIFAGPRLEPERFRFGDFVAL
jgi:hypothetical protein